MCRDRGTVGWLLMCTEGEVVWVHIVCLVVLKNDRQEWQVVLLKNGKQGWQVVVLKNGRPEW